MKLYRAQVQDAPRLAQVHVDSWRVAYRGLVPDAFLQGFTYQKREEAFRRALAADSEETYLMEVNECAAGILTIGAGHDADLNVSLTGEIWGIYIAPNYWRRGIGRKLVQEAERLLRSRGYRGIILWVLEGNTMARRFCEAMGFTLDRVFKTVNLGTPLEAVRYKKRLEPDEPTE